MIEKPQVDMSVVIIFHHEGFYAIPALASLAEMLAKTIGHGLTVETIAILDDADDLTLSLVKTHGTFLSHIQEVSYSNLNLSRNMAVEYANGEFLAFLDGGDLWGSDWLHLAYAAATTSATDEETIWHPESIFYFHEADLHKEILFKDKPHPDALAYHFFQSSTNEPEFDRRFLLFHHIWTSNFFAKRTLYMRFPYQMVDPEHGYRMADWLWHVQTTWMGITHVIVPDTVHQIRLKDSAYPWEQQHISQRILINIPPDALKDCHVVRHVYQHQVAIKPLKESLQCQIMEQALHEPAIVSSGYYTIKHLKCIHSNDFFIRHQINIHAMHALFAQKTVKWLVIQDHIMLTGSQKYLSTMIDTIHHINKEDVFVCIIDPNKKNIPTEVLNKFHVLLHLKDANLFFLSNIYAKTNDYIIKTEHLLNILRPHYLLMHTNLSTNISRTTSHVLSKYSNIYCIYFTFVPLTIDANSIEIISRKVISYANIVVDNSLSFKKITKLLGNKNIYHLPPQFVFPEELFKQRLNKRYKNAIDKTKQIKWAWVGRIDAIQKGLFLLQKIAHVKPQYIFDVFGPTVQKASHVSPNMHYKGVIEDIASTNFEDYNGFLFTSIYEGMPSIILEMSAHAIPMVISDVGGLKDTFDDTSVVFVNIQQNIEHIVHDFVNALDHVLNMHENDMISMLQNAAYVVQQKHSADIYLQNFSHIFDMHPKEDLS